MCSVKTALTVVGLHEDTDSHLTGWLCGEPCQMLEIVRDLQRCTAYTGRYSSKATSNHVSTAVSGRDSGVSTTRLRMLDAPPDPKPANHYALPCFLNILLGFLSHSSGVSD